MNIILQAVKFAANAHRGQVRKYTGTPYIHHPLRVMGRTALLANTTELMCCVAVLHDTAEDSGVTWDQLCKEFRTHVADGVSDLTNPSKRFPHLSRAEKKKMDREHLKSMSSEVKQIKMLDRIDNLLEMNDAPREFRLMYLDESELLLEEIKDADPLLAEELRLLIDKQRAVLADSRDPLQFLKGVL